MDRREFLTASASAAAVLAGGCVGAASGSVTRQVNSPTFGHEVSIEKIIGAAFLYGFGPYEFVRMATAAASLSGSAQNVLAHRRFMTTPKNRSITAPNIDTLYSSAFLELSGGPMIVTTPDAPERYHSIAFMNTFTDNFAYLGTRLTGGRSVTYWIVGPEWEGNTPDGVGLIRSDTNDVWMIGRTLVSDANDLEAAQRVQSQIELAPHADRGPALPFASLPGRSPTAPGFLETVNEVLGRSPTNRGHARRAAAFYEAGIRPGEADVWSALTDSQRQIWTSTIPATLAALKSNAVEQLDPSPGWVAAPADIGRFGENDRLRSSVALRGLAALSSEEATYFQTVRDQDGVIVDGTQAYTFTVPPEGAPVDAFWSLTMYSGDEEGRFFLVENSIDRYSIGDRTTGLLREPDGSFVLHLQPDRPAGDRVANWLPTPRERFMVIFRAYLPGRAILNGEWTPPPLVRSTPA